MSEILIKNMEMPKSCSVCPLCQEQASDYCGHTEDEIEDLYNRRNTNCPLVEVPTPHGDIKDTKDILNRLALKPTYDVVSTLLSIQSAVDESPTIIEASKERK